MIAISSLRYVEKVDLMTTVAQRVPRSRRPKQQALIDEARKRQRGGSGRRFAIAVVTIAAAVGIAYGITRATLTSAPSAAIRLPNPCLLLPTKEVEQILRVNVGVVTRIVGRGRDVARGCLWAGPRLHGYAEPAGMALWISRQTKPAFVRNATVANGDVEVRGVGASAFAPPDWPGGSIKVWKHGYSIMILGQRGIPKPTLGRRVDPNVAVKRQVPLIDLKRLGAIAAKHL